MAISTGGSRSVTNLSDTGGNPSRGALSRSASQRWSRRFKATPHALDGRRWRLFAPGRHRPFTSSQDTPPPPSSAGETSKSNRPGMREHITAIMEAS